MIIIAKNKGFVALFAILSSTLILTLTIAMLNANYKDQVLGVSAKESAFSHFGADSGLECALYNDIKGNLFPEPEEFLAGTVPAPNTIRCIGADAGQAIVSDIEMYAPNKYKFLIDASDGYGVTIDDGEIKEGCIEVFVDKDGAGSQTNVVSRGYNVSCDRVQSLAEPENQGEIDPKIVERRVAVRYTSSGGGGGETTGKDTGTTTGNDAGGTTGGP